MKSFAFFDDLANALLLEIPSEAAQDRAQQQLNAFAAALKLDPTVKDFFLNPEVPWEQKMHALKKSLPEAEDALINTLLLVIRQNRLDEVGSFAGRFAHVRSEKGLARQVVVRSADKLSKDERHALIDQLERKWKMRVVLEERIDPAVIGGFTLQSEDWEYDGTVKGRLQRLAQTLKT